MGEALPAFAAAALQDRAAAARAHPRPESVGLGPLPLLRLVGALHWASQYTDASRPGGRTGAEIFLRHLRRARISAERRAAMVARRCPTTPTGQNLDSLWRGRPAAPAGARSRSRPSSSGWSRCSVLGAQGTTLYLAAPDGIRTWVERRYAALIGEALDGRRRGAERDQLRRGWRAGRPERDRAPAVELNPNYTFERFVIGEGNRVAHAAALAVAEAPSEAYNPLFLHGPPGLGKTHLLVAIANYLRANAPGLSVRYTTAECFTNEFVDALRTQRRRGVQAPLPRPRRAARRRRPVPRGQAAHRRGVLPHLQRPLRGRQPARPLRRPHAERALDPRGAAARPLRVGPDGRRSSRPTSPPASPSCAASSARPASTADDGDALAELARRIDANVRQLHGALTRVIAHASLTAKPLSPELIAELIPNRSPAERADAGRGDPAARRHRLRHLPRRAGRLQPRRHAAARPPGRDPPHPRGDRPLPAPDRPPLRRPRSLDRPQLAAPGRGRARRGRRPRRQSRRVARRDPQPRRPNRPDGRRRCKNQCLPTAQLHSLQIPCPVPIPGCFSAVSTSANPTQEGHRSVEADHQTRRARLQALDRLPSRLHPRRDPGALRHPARAPTSGAVSLAATDLEMGLQHDARGRGRRRRARSCSPAGCSPSSPARSATRRVEIELRESERDVEIRSGGSSFHLRVLPAEDFPKLPGRGRASR